MKKLLILTLLTLFSLVSKAYVGEAVVDGINYYIITKTKTAEVRANYGKYSGHVVIPSTIEYDGVTCNVTSIGDATFRECKSLTSVIIPNSITNIGDYAFYDCLELTYVTIPNSVTNIGKYAFTWDKSMTSLIIPNSVLTIGIGAFAQCWGITTVTIGDGLSIIEEDTFSDCRSMVSVTIGNGVKSIGKNSFARCGLTSLEIPEDVTSIGNSAFQSCSNIITVTIPNSVKSIDGSAFYNCSKMSSLIIGNGIKNINNSAFQSCSDLTDVYCYAESVPSTAPDVFNGSLVEYATLHVPVGSIYLYKTISPWNVFGEIVALDKQMEEKCKKPTISYANGQLKYECDTEGVEFKTTITDSDVNDHTGNIINLTATYNISVYATKEGYENSEVATATLCWIDAEPWAEGTKEAEDKVTEVKAMPVLIQANDGTLNISGAPEGADISVYDTSGRELGNVIAVDGKAKIAMPKTDKIAIVKIGDKAVKVGLK